MYPSGIYGFYLFALALLSEQHCSQRLLSTLPVSGARQSTVPRPAPTMHPPSMCTTANYNLASIFLFKLKRNERAGRHFSSRDGASVFLKGDQAGVCPPPEKGGRTGARWARRPAGRPGSSGPSTQGRAGPAAPEAAAQRLKAPFRGGDTPQHVLAGL